MTSLAVIGPNGQLGSDLVNSFRSAGWTVVPGSHEAVAVEDRDSVESFLTGNRVDVVITTAAFHQVALCEREVARSWAVNATGSRNVAVAAQRIGAVCVFVSTDYVFDGELDSARSYPEDSPICPVNVYGASKAGGEAAVLAASDRNLVVRISSVFGAAGSSGKGGNFVETIAAKALTGQPLEVVDDMWMSPSYTVDVAQKMRALLDAGASGIFHACNAGRVTWHEFASEICAQIGSDVDVGRSTADLSATPRRPRNSSLSTAKLDALGIPQRSWRDALAAYLSEKGHAD